MKDWVVEVSIGPEPVLTIGSGFIGGKASLTIEDEEVIREAAESLLAFIGKPLNQVVEDLCSCASSGNEYWEHKEIYHCGFCDKPINEQD